MATFLKKKVKGSVEGRGREHEHGGLLAASAMTSTRLAGVINRWLPSGGGHVVVKKGEIKM